MQQQQEDELIFGNCVVTIRQEGNEQTGKLLVLKKLLPNDGEAGKLTVIGKLCSLKTSGKICALPHRLIKPLIMNEQSFKQ